MVMIRVKTKYWFFLFILLFVSCEKSDDIQRTTVSLESFTFLNLHDNINLVLINDSIDQAIIEANNNLLDYIDCKQKEDSLIIKNKHSHGWTKGYDNYITVYLHFTNLNRILYQGNGNITDEDTLRFSSFWIGTMKGSGTIDLTLKGTYFSLANSTGTSDYNFYGNCNRLVIRNDAVGVINTFKLEADTVAITHNGTNDMYIKSNKKLNAKVMYVGDLYYRGNPINIDTTLESSGKIYQIF